MANAGYSEIVEHAGDEKIEDELEVSQPATTTDNYTNKESQPDVPMNKNTSMIHSMVDDGEEIKTLRDNNSMLKKPGMSAETS